MKRQTKRQKVLGLVCTLTGIALAIFGISYMNRTKYSNSNVSVDIPETKIDDSVYLVEK